MLGQELWPVVSVVVPVYNVKLYLRECLDSITNQTLQNIEIICINDGSTDGSADILNEYASRDSRILIVNQENKGLSAARNLGMSMAVGEYLCFIDSDDFVELDLLEITSNISRQFNADAVVFGFDCFSDVNVEKRTDSLKTCGIYSGIECMKAMRKRQLCSSVVWRVLWKNAFLRSNDLSFLDGIIYEDLLFSFNAYICAATVYVIPDILYHNRQRSGSITKKGLTSLNAISAFLSLYGIIEYTFHETYDPDHEEVIIAYYNDFLNMTRDTYFSLSQDERRNVIFQRELQNFLFKQLVIGDQEKINALTKELDGTRASWTYKIGRFITWIPRKVREIRSWVKKVK